MDGIVSWILSLFAVIVIGLLVDVLFTGTRIAKFIKTVCALSAILIVVMPLPALIKNGFNLENGFLGEYDAALDTGYLEYIGSYKSAIISAGIKKNLSDDGISGASVSVNIKEEDGEIIIEQVNVNLSDAVIDEKYAHINKNELVKQLIVEYLGIDQSGIKVYE